MVNKTPNLESTTSTDCSSADGAKSAAGNVNCTNLLDSEWFVSVLYKSGRLLVLSGGTQCMSAA